MISTKGLTHIQLTVRDLERSLAFYTRVFGLKEQFREGGHMVFLNTPGTEDLITLNADPREPRRAGDNGGINHFGFRLTRLSDMDAAVREVEAAGGTLISRGEHAPGVPFAYVRDPDGYVLELSA
jgi:catechol 2,3-dioxygenase-like lactoylglutathione lyase family enzyme